MNINKRFCKNCVYVKMEKPKASTWVCTHSDMTYKQEVNPVSGAIVRQKSYMHCDRARELSIFCGPEGRCFVPSMELKEIPEETVVIKQKKVSWIKSWFGIK